MLCWFGGCMAGWRYKAGFRLNWFQPPKELDLNWAEMIVCLMGIIEIHGNVGAICLGWSGPEWFDLRCLIIWRLYQCRRNGLKCVLNICLECLGLYINAPRTRNEGPFLPVSVGESFCFFRWCLESYLDVSRYNILGMLRDSKLVLSWVWMKVCEVWMVVPDRLGWWEVLCKG